MEKIYLKPNKIKQFKFWDKWSEAKQPHFIGSWNIKNDELCKKIITFFEENKVMQESGAVGSVGAANQTSAKKTTDITINPSDLKDIKFKCLNDYINELNKCFSDYQDQWKFLKDMIPEPHVGSFNIQKYSQGDHFSRIHTERSSLATSHRILAWMTYLNDVDDGGTTNFTHYGVKIKPEIGKTLIWPSEWTHAHSGEILNSGTKYIVTGWIHFPHNSE